MLDVKAPCWKLPLLIRPPWRAHVDEILKHVDRDRWVGAKYHVELEKHEPRPCEALPEAQRLQIIIMQLEVNSLTL
eukprot:CAMPEP_0181183406 /NCGR_PEP_ID=MMETSP1096-20121128/8409_1 /TAXON_ID=156174 ORGANISM="Chrysochromulina ericina, Strain CCMP281" /NCGR_SAMPLE_ID=MMETSP1096 /ASSEMBLY_ACC=CAM_ASM_000453 /LENGTH=75 /DNA_ID=CAMNT_0023272085 /DNA_START=1042 /DNA_END=1269 /DNA_ORIENTATION=-